MQITSYIYNSFKHTLSYPIVWHSGVSPEAAMYVLPIVLILVIKRNSSLSSNWWKRQNIAKQEKYNACKM